MLALRVPDLGLGLSVVDCIVDLNFVVDSSGSINYIDPRNWDKTRTFIANVVRQFTIGRNNVQVAYVLFSSDATVEWGLTRYQNQESLVNAIRNVRYLGDMTNLNDALYLTRTQVFAPGRGTRRGARKVTVILTDGEDNVPEQGTPLTLQNATLCKNDGIQLIAIGVSNSVDQRRLLQIVSSTLHYYPLDDFSDLSGIINKLTPHICSAADTSMRRTPFSLFLVFPVRMRFKTSTMTIMHVGEIGQSADL